MLSTSKTKTYGMTVLAAAWSSLGPAPETGSSDSTLRLFR